MIRADDDFLLFADDADAADAYATISCRAMLPPLYYAITPD